MSHSKNYFLTGDKVGLRPMSREDLPLCQNWYNNPDVTRYLEMGWRPSSPADLEAVYKEATEDKNAVVAVVCDKETGKAIGTVGLYLILWPGRRAQFRILLGEPELFGNGFGTEATKLIVDYGFKRLNLATIYLGVNAENAGAVKAYKKAGFVEEGRQRQFIYNNGRFYDCLMMSILRQDYLKESV